jgi:hypothetical protein
VILDAIFFHCSVVHALAPKVEDKTIVVPNALQLMVEQSKRIFLLGFGCETECLNDCGKDVWSSR